MVVYIIDKLPCHLCGHKGVGNAVFLKIFIQCHQVEAHLLWNNIDGGSSRERCPEFHHDGIEAETGVCPYAAVGINVVDMTVHPAE